jgi:hypothetical protein
MLSIAFVFWSSIATMYRQDFESESEWLVIVNACTAFLFTIKLLSYMRGFDSTGWLITVLTQNVVDVKGFFVLMAIILGGFTVIFKILLREVEGGCKLQLPLDDVSVVAEDCDIHPFTLYGLAAFNVFNMGIMVCEPEDRFCTYIDVKNNIIWFACCDEFNPIMILVMIL